MKSYFLLIVPLFILVWPTLGYAHQPVMDMAPRWDGGYGFQFRYDYVDKDRLMSGSSKVSNPSNLRSHTSTWWYEGVYSFKREHRLTFKMPVVYRNALLTAGSSPLSAGGPGDLILGFQNKLYFNEKGITGNVGITPSIRIPTGETGANLPIGRGTVDFALSLAGSIESFKFYSLLDFYTWIHTEGVGKRRPGHIFGVDLDLGYHPYHDMSKNQGIFLMTGFRGRYYGQDKVAGALDPNSGRTTFDVIPTLVYYRNNMMVRAEYYIPVYRDVTGTQLTDSIHFQLGVGFTFQSFKPL